MKSSVLVERALGPNPVRMDALVAWPRQEENPQILGHIFGKLPPEPDPNAEFRSGIGEFFASKARP